MSVPAGSTLLEAGAGLRAAPSRPSAGTRRRTSNGLCRMCVVEVEGQRVLQPACIVTAAEGMKVQTGSERVMRARRTILEMLASTVDLSEAPEILP